MTPPRVPPAAQAREDWHQDRVGCREGEAESRAQRVLGAWGFHWLPLTERLALMSGSLGWSDGAALPTWATFFCRHHPWGRGLHIASSLGSSPWLSQPLLSCESFPAESILAEAANPILPPVEGRAQTAGLARCRCLVQEHPAWFGGGG